MSLSMCILWLPVIWLSRRVFPYVSVFKHGDSHPLWSCCLLGKFLWTKISELPKLTPIQEILVDVGFEYKCKSWILAALYNPAFCYWFCSPNLYWSRNNTTTWNDSEGIWGFFFQVVTLQAWGVAEACSGAVDLCRCLLDARPRPKGKHWGPRWREGLTSVWGEGLSNKGLLKSRSWSWGVPHEWFHWVFT